MLRDLHSLFGEGEECDVTPLVLKRERERECVVRERGENLRLGGSLGLAMVKTGEDSFLLTTGTLFKS